jgi:hypothetical protein
VRTQRWTTVLGVVALGVGSAVLVGPATKAAASTTAKPTLYVSPGASNAADGSCTTAGYGTIQSAVNAAAAGNKIVVCAGTYPEQVTIKTSNLTLTAQGTATIQPTSATSNAADLDNAQPIVAILAVEAPATGVQLAGLTVDGSGIQSLVNGCGTDLVGVLYQASTGTASATMKHLTIENTTPSNSGCGSGLGILAQAGTTGASKATLSISNNTVTGYGKNGITCSDLGIKCTITGNTITTAATGAVAQNGVQVGFGAYGSVSNNTISGNYWTAYGADTNPQVQSDYASGVLLYAAGIDSAGIATLSTSVNGNHFMNNQIGVEVVDSVASVKGNSILESSPGIGNSIGVYGVGCDAYCGYFTANNGSFLNTVAASGQRVSVAKNTIDFASPAPSGSYGIWLGDDGWVSATGYYGPAGSETVTVANPSIHNVTHPLVIDPGATLV